MTLETDCIEIAQLAQQLRPGAFVERIAYWRSNGAGGSWLSEFVSGSPERSIPVTQPTDKEGKPTGPPMLKDRLDRELQLTKRDYVNCINDAVRLLRTAAGFEKRWLFDIATATEDLAELVSDFPSCIGCGETREQWERSHKGQRIRVKRGLYQDCYEAFRRSGEEFSVWAAGRKKLEATG